MAKPSFANLKQQLDDACQSLRVFTLGQRGSTQRGGLEAIALVQRLCDRLKRLFTSGPHAAAAAALVVMGHSRVGAAEIRMALLKKRRLGRVPTAS